jgi:serine/threonine protein kinase
LQQILDGRAVITSYFLATSKHSESFNGRRFCVFWPKGTAAAQAIQPASLHAARADEISYTAPLWPCSPQADARTDIFAFGAVIYEMATGRKAFEAKLVAVGMVSGFLHP